MEHTDQQNPQKMKFIVWLNTNMYTALTATTKILYTYFLLTNVIFYLKRHVKEILSKIKMSSVKTLIPTIYHLFSVFKY